MIELNHRKWAVPDQMLMVLKCNNSNTFNWF
jgi:hypothetical protein